MGGRTDEAPNYWSQARFRARFYIVNHLPITVARYILKGDGLNRLPGGMGTGLMESLKWYQNGTCRSGAGACGEPDFLQKWS